MEKDKLKILLNMFNAFNIQELEKITSCFFKKNVSKNQILLHEGNICKEFYLISKGCFHTYFMDKNGRQKTRYIMPDFHIGTALASFIAQKPSLEYIEALEDSTILAINYNNFMRLNNEIESFRNFYQKILEMAYTFQNNKIEDLVTLTARQRYAKVLRQQPEFIQRLSNRILASYLDMRDETLSRLKADKTILI